MKNVINQLQLSASKIRREAASKFTALNHKKLYWLLLPAKQGSQALLSATVLGCPGLTRWPFDLTQA
eukprot:g3415.t1